MEFCLCGLSETFQRDSQHSVCGGRRWVDVESLLGGSDGTGEVSRIAEDTGEL